MERVKKIIEANKKPKEKPFFFSGRRYPDELNDVFFPLLVFSSFRLKISERKKSRGEEREAHTQLTEKEENEGYPRVPNKMFCGGRLKIVSVYKGPAECEREEEEECRGGRKGVETTTDRKKTLS